MFKRREKKESQELDSPKNTMVFLPEEIQIGFGNPHPTVLELAMHHDLPLNHSCGGMGTCGTCRVVIESDLTQLPARNEIEAEMAAERSFAPCERLACQLGAQHGLVIRIPE